MPGQPLPSLPERLSRSPTILDAYNILLAFEKEAAALKDEKILRHARILGYLILHGPSDAARSAVALDVNSCNLLTDNEADLRNNLSILGDMYFSRFICAFRKFKPHTPTPFSHASRPLYENRKAMIKAMLTQTPKTHTEAKKNALIRDGFRSVVSGWYDLTCIERSDELLQESSHENVLMCYTQCAHIFPQSVNANIEVDKPENFKLDYAASVWAVMDRFGNTSVSEELNGSGIHRLENILTLDTRAHEFFDSLHIYFEPHETLSNSYYLRVLPPLRWLPEWKEIVTFETPDPQRLPLPSPRYLALHAACAKVAHLSGASEYMWEIQRKLEDIDVLSADGSSSEVLEYALLPMLQAVPVQ